MEKCVACQHYDRDDAQASDKGTRWGKCRRNGPIIHPLSAKAYMVEGIWPHVRDDDWCGEWKSSLRRSADPRFADFASTAAAGGALAAQPGAVPLRPAPMSVNTASPMAALAIGAASRGSD